LIRQSFDITEEWAEVGWSDSLPAPMGGIREIGVIRLGFQEIGGVIWIRWIIRDQGQLVAAMPLDQ
jgi:hypothetical protein